MRHTAGKTCQGLSIFDAVRQAEKEAGMISEFSSCQDMLQPNFTEEEIAQINQRFTEHPSGATKKRLPVFI